MIGIALNRILPVRAIVAALAFAGLAAACSSGNVEYNYPDKKPGQPVDPVGSTKKSEGVFGTDGIKLWGPSDKQADAGGGGGGIGVNSFLWRASLDSISFMPLVSADPFGGVIITDWYTPAEATGERFKVNIFILGRQLRADGLKAAVFKQRKDAAGGWVDAAVEPKTAIELENTILTRARQLRIDTARP